MIACIARDDGLFFTAAVRLRSPLRPKLTRAMDTVSRRAHPQLADCKHGDSFKRRLSLHRNVQWTFKKR